MKERLVFWPHKKNVMAGLSACAEIQESGWKPCLKMLKRWHLLQRSTSSSASIEIVGQEKPCLQMAFLIAVAPK